MNITKERIKLYTYYLTVIIAFILPLNKRFVPILIVLLLLSSLFTNKLKDKYFRFKKNIVKEGGWLVGLYGLYFISFFYSDDKSTASFDLQLKLSLLVFPLIFVTTSFIDQKRIRKICIAFVEGVITAGVLCFAFAGYRYYINPDTSEFFYSSFSLFHHAGYFAMYTNLALVIVLNWLIRYERVFNKYVLTALVMFLSLMVFLLASKAGILTWMMVAVWGFVSWAVKSRSVIKAVLPVLLSVILAGSVYMISERVKQRVDVALESVILKPDARDATSNKRVKIWKTAIQEVVEHPLAGYGNGDAKKALLKAYKAKGYSSLYEQELNAHNQILQTTLCVGVLGGLAVLLIIIQLFTYGIRGRDWLLLGFAIILSVNMMTEAIFETQAGVVFFSFFYILLLKRKQLE